MKTVIVFTTNYHPFLGGAESAIEEIAKRISREFTFIIVTARHDRALPRRERRPEGTVLRIGFGTRYDKWLLMCAGGFIAAWKLFCGEWKYVRRRRACLLWGVDISQGSIAAALASNFFPRIPFVLNVQYGYGDQRLAGGRFGMINVAFRHMLARATLVTAISSYLSGVVQRYHFRGVLEIVPNGVDWKEFSSGRNSGVSARHRIVTISRLVPKNGVDILVRAVKEVKKEFPDVSCTIIGDGPERKNLEMLASDLAVKDIVHFLGSIPNANLPGLLSQADIFVRPSRSEGMGNAFLQALAAGLPIIGTNVGGIPDIITDGETGLFAAVDDPADTAKKIIQLFRDAALRESIVQKGGTLAKEHFSWDAIAGRYARIFATELAITKRILIATPLYPPDPGGPATYTETLLQHLPQQNIGVHVAYFGDFKHFPKGIRHVMYFWKVFWHSRGRDVVFAQDPVSTGFPAMLAARSLRKRFVLKVVGDYAWEQWQQGRNMPVFVSPEEFQSLRADIKTSLRKYTERFTAKQAECVVVPSRYLKRLVGYWGVAAERVFVIPNAFNTPPCRLNKEESREKLGLSGTILLSAGRFVPWKGFAKLIEIMPALLKEVPDLQLIMIGDGPDWEHCRTKAKNLNIAEHVIFTGPLPHERLLSYLRAGDVFVLNTGYEGMSHVLLEAMAMEIPIVTTNICGNPEIIENGMNGVLVTYNNGEELLNAVKKILAEADFRRTIVANAREKIKEFSRENMIAETKNIL